jgi:hypothetical protein
MLTKLDLQGISILKDLHGLKRYTMDNNDMHFFKEWIRKKNERSLKNKIRLERIRNEFNKKKEKDNDKKSK